MIRRGRLAGEGGCVSPQNPIDHAGQREPVPDGAAQCFGFRGSGLLGFRDVFANGIGEGRDIGGRDKLVRLRSENLRDAADPGRDQGLRGSGRFENDVG